MLSRRLPHARPPRGRCCRAWLSRRPPRCRARHLDSVAVSGNSRIPLATVKADAGIKAGHTLNYRVVQRSIKNLYATGNYDDVQVRCDVNPVTGKTMLASSSSSGRCSRRVGQRRHDHRQQRGEGEVELPIGRPVDPALVARAVERIDSAYRDEGLLPREGEGGLHRHGRPPQARLRGHRGEPPRDRLGDIVGNKHIKTSTTSPRSRRRPRASSGSRRASSTRTSWPRTSVRAHSDTLYKDRGYIDFQVLQDTILGGPA